MSLGPYCAIFPASLVSFSFSAEGLVTWVCGEERSRVWARPLKTGVGGGAGYGGGKDFSKTSMAGGRKYIQCVWIDEERYVSQTETYASRI